MTLLDVVHLPPIEPWTEGEKIPWNDPAFSRRMLKEHLSQDHDLASRRSAKIDLHVRFLHETILLSQPTKILDLGCGPGLYAGRLQALGHDVTGIDFSPASIEYARGHSACRFVEGDVRTTSFGDGYGLAMLVFGEANVFSAEDLSAILRRTHDSLVPGGQIVLEVHTYEAVRAWGQRQPSWHAVESGLFSDRPYLFLEQSLWDESTETATNRMLGVDAETGVVSRYGSTMQAYDEAGYRTLLESGGFDGVAFYPSLTGSLDPEQPCFEVVTASH